MSVFDLLSGFNPFEAPKAQQHYQDFYVAEQPKHESSLTHEGLAAAAGFAAMHAYEAHLRATGQPVSHGKMKEILAAIAAAEVDKLAETKGLDWVDRHKAKKMAQHQAHHLAAQRYGEGATGWEYAQSAAGPRQEYNFQGGAPFGARGCPSYGWHEQYGYGQQQGGYGGGYGGGGGYPGGGGAQGYGGYPPPNEGGYYQPPPPGPPQGYSGGYGGPGGYDQPQVPPPQGYYQGGYEQAPPQEYYGAPPQGEGYGEGRHHRHHHRED